MTYLLLFGGGVKTNLSAKTFVLSTVLASSLAFPALSQAGINLDGNPIEITGQKFEQDSENKDLTISIDNGQVGISAKQESDVTIDNLHSLNIQTTDNVASTGNTYGIQIDNSNLTLNLASSVEIDVSHISDALANDVGETSALNVTSNVGNNHQSDLTISAGSYINVSSIALGKQISSLGIKSVSGTATTLVANSEKDGWGININSESKDLDSYGFLSQYNSSVNLTSNNGAGIYINSTGYRHSYAVNVGTDSTNTPASASINSSGDVFLKSTATSSSSSGIFVSSFSSKADLTLEAKKLTIESEVLNDSAYSYGINAQQQIDGLSSIQLFVDELSVKSVSSDPSKSYGVFSHQNSHIYATVKGDTTINADYAGLWGQNSNSLIDISSEGSTTIDAGYVAIWAQSGASIDVTSNQAFTAINRNQIGVYAYLSDVLIDSGYNEIRSDSGAIEAFNGSVSLTADSNNAIFGKQYGVYSDGNYSTTKISQVTLTSGLNNVVESSGRAVNAINKGNVTLTAEDSNEVFGTEYGIYNNSSGVSLNAKSNLVQGGKTFESDGLRYGDGWALFATRGGVTTLNSADGQNEILGKIQTKEDKSKIEFLSNTNILSAASYAVSAKTNGHISIKSEGVDGGNFIYSGYQNGFGTERAISADSGGTVELSSETENNIYGAILAKDADSAVSVQGLTNKVSSFGVIPNAGDLNNATDNKFKDNRVISALYAEGKDAQISLTGEQNYLSTFADSSVHTDLERVVWAYDGADINIAGFTSITTDSYEKSLNSIDIAIAAGTAVNLTEDIVTTPVEDRAQVQINYANTTDSEGKAVLSSVTGDILSAYAGSVKIAPKSASDGLVVTGNLLAGNNGELTVDIAANGVLTGRADDYGDAGFIKDSEHTTFFDPAFSSEIFKGGQVNLKMGDNARWNVTGQSWITDISVADGAKNVLIDLVNANTDRNSTAHALTVYNLKGNATFNMSLDGNRDVSDMLYIRNANGEYNVNVVDAVTVDDMYKGGLNGLRFATVGAGSKAKFRAFTYDKGALNVEYEVATDSYDNNPENDIYNGTEMSHEKPGSTVVDGLFGYEEGAVATLALNDEAATKAADGTISETTNFKLVDRKDATPSDSGKTIIDHARANYANAVQLDTLNKRQGEMRFSQGHEDGLWARIRHDDIGKRSSFRLDNTMVEVGVDSRYVKETGEFHTGVAFDYMNGDTDYHHISGEGDLDRYGVWFYTTWLGNEGDYTDFIIKCSLIDNEYKIYAPTTGEKITGDYDNNVISVSLEHGKKYSNEESWFIEPQAQLQYAYVTSAEYTNSQGTDVRLDGIHSLIGRVGVRAGKDVTRDNPFTFYARGDIMHEFMGKQDIKAKDATGTMRVRYENDDTWYSAGLGMSYLHNKDKYYFLEAEKVFGGSNTSSYIVSGGVRFLFD